MPRPRPRRPRTRDGAARRRGAFQTCRHLTHAGDNEHGSFPHLLTMGANSCKDASSFYRGQEMAELDDIASETKRLIQAYVDEQWANSQAVCYFSSIGTYLKRMEPKSRFALSKGLADFLRQNPVVRVVQFPGVAEKLGAIPLSVPLPKDPRELFLRDTLSSGSRHHHVYVQEFWEAFIRTIDDVPRYVLVDDADHISVHNGPIDHERGAVYEIQRQDLTPNLPDGSIADRVNATHSAIDTWLTKHSLAPSAFFRSRGPKRILSTANNLANFMTVFDCLSSDDLARIQIPLDILFKLISKK